MKATRPTVSIGIAAHNEEKNIALLLAALLNQHQSNWKLIEILVYCDGCTDQTASLAKSLASKYIRVIDDGKRKGKVGRINQACREFKSESLVIFDADIQLNNRNVIDYLVETLFAKKEIALVGGNSQPHAPNTFFQHAVYSAISTYLYCRENIKEGNNVFACTGACFAMKKHFAKSLTIPDNVINEDDYIYFYCLQNKYKFFYAKRAVVFYKLPTKLADYLRQVFRSTPDAVHHMMMNQFGLLVTQEYKRPIQVYLKGLFISFKNNPIGFLYIGFIRALCLPLFPVISKKYNLNWYTAESTK